MDTEGDWLPIAVRAWTTRTKPAKKAAKDRPASSVKRRYPNEVLVFDTETLDEPGQRLMVGMWRTYRDNYDADPGTTCIDEGFFYPDDLPTIDPDGFTTLTDYVTRREAEVSVGFSPQLKLWPLSQWLDERLFEYGYRHRNRCSVVGFNLMFDFGGLAQYFSPAQGTYYGGWSLSFWGGPTDTSPWDEPGGHPRLLMKSIDPRRTLMSWGLPRGKSNTYEAAKGGARFVDLRTLTFALTDRSYTLEGACEAFGHTYAKRGAEYGRISNELLTYGLEDVAATAELYRRCMRELSLHEGIELAPHTLYSPATVGARYLQAMSVEPPLQRHDLPDEFLGEVMSAFYGGRAEARIVRTPMPVALVDFTSMYPAQNALLDTWPIITADTLSLDDVTDHVRELVNAPDLVDRLMDATVWRDDIGVTFVELDHIDGAVLPVRAAYEPTTSQGDGGGLQLSDSGNFGIGVNPLHYDGRLVYALPDVLAAALLGTPAFTIRRATRVMPHGVQPDLQPVTLRGHRTINPASEDPFLAMIEERHRIKHDITLSNEERDRLDQFLKITANATSYGSLARMDRKELANPVKVTAHGPAGSVHQVRISTPEEPGPYCFPPVAASITAGARLMLALIERRLADRGGSYAFMDTDSIAIVTTETGGPVPCPGEPNGELNAISHQAILDLLGEFSTLNPYGDEVINDDPRIPRSPWKVEKNSLSEPLTAMVIAAKRYLLYRDLDGAPEIVAVVDTDDDEADGQDGEAPDDPRLVDWSEHGLGLYQDPLGRRDAKKRRVWMRDAWDHMLATLLDTSRTQPSWFATWALTQFTMSSPRQRSWFDAAPRGTPDSSVPRPGSFGLLAQVDPLTVIASPTPMPAAPFAKESSRWGGLPWYDRTTAQPLIVTSSGEGVLPEQFAEQLMAGGVAFRTLGQVVGRYVQRPEHKSLAPDGEPTGPQTSGRLRRRPVRAIPATTRLIGKEGNKLLERRTGGVTASEGSVVLYGTIEDEWRSLYLPVLRAMGVKAVAEATGVTARRVRPWLKGDVTPHDWSTDHQSRAKRAAVNWARTALGAASNRMTDFECLEAALEGNLRTFAAH